MQPAKKEMSCNSSQFSQAIKKELEYINEKDPIISCKSEDPVKYEVIVEQGDGDQPLSHPLQDNLKMHIVSQNEELPFRCYICEKGFRNKRTQKNHENGHLGLRPYQEKLNHCT